MYSVLKGSSYFLAHTPDMVVYNGTTQTLQRKIDPDSEYLKEISNHHTRLRNLCRLSTEPSLYWKHDTRRTRSYRDPLVR